MGMAFNGDSKHDKEVYHRKVSVFHLEAPIQILKKLANIINHREYISN